MNVIVVDDEKIAMENMLLKLNGIPEIASAIGYTNPKEALEHVERIVTDVAFLDISMRQMDGLTLAKKLREICPNLFIIFITGYSEYAAQAFQMHVSGYLMKPVRVEDIQREILFMQNPPKPLKKKKRLRAQCFGNFEVFLDGEPLRFQRARTKELLAYLIDRHGATCNTGMLCGILWEDEEITSSRKSQLRNYISELSRILEDANQSDVLIKSRNSFAINTSAIDCDYFGFLEGDAASVNRYCGEYMSQYSWADMTLGGLEMQ